MSIKRDLSWSLFGEIGSKAIQPLLYIILARILSPSDFGVMASALMVLSLKQVLWEAGLGKALLQNQSNIAEAANVTFWTNLILGIFLAILLLVFAPWIAIKIFHDSRVGEILRVMAAYLVLGASSSVHLTLLQKEFGFKQLFWVKFAANTLPSIVSLILALRGSGYWGLVAGQIAGQFFQNILLWKMSSWRPSFKVDINVARDLLGFGSWVGLSGLLVWFYTWADSLIVGMYLGSHELGLYRTGSQFVTLIFGLLFNPISPVLEAHLARMNRDLLRLRMAIEKVIKAMAILAIPLGTTIFAVSSPLSYFIFGEKWAGISEVIAILSLMHSLAWVVGLNGEFYRSLGKPSYDTIVTSIALFFYIAGYLFSIKFGLEPFLKARLILATMALVGHFCVLAKALGVNLLKDFWLIMRIFTVSILMGMFTRYAFSYLETKSIIIFILTGCLTLLMTLAALALIEGMVLFQEIRSIVRK